MVYYIVFAIGIRKHRVMSLGNKTIIHMIPFIVTHKTGSDCSKTITAYHGISPWLSIYTISYKSGIVSTDIFIWAGKWIRCPDSHIITFCSFQSFIRNEKVVFAANLFNVRCLAAAVSKTAACDLNSHVRIRFIHLILILMCCISKACCFIQLNEVDTAIPGSIGHPQFTVIIQHTRINGMSTIFTVRTRLFECSSCCNGWLCTIFYHITGIQICISCYCLVICLGVVIISLIKTRVYNGTLSCPVSIQRLGCKQGNNRVTVDTGNTHVHHPGTLGTITIIVIRIPDHIRRPQVSMDIPITCTLSPHTCPFCIFRK